MAQKIRTCIGFIIILCGLGMFLYPNVMDYIQNSDTTAYVNEFNNQYYSENGNEASGSGVSSETVDKNGVDSGGETASASIAKESDPLYQNIQAYNKNLYETNQSEFTSTWICAQPVEIEGLDQKFGYIEIPSMDLTLPLYVGASDSHMARGAAVLTQTSLPIGGINTNSAIAGHRGWQTGSFFKNIERLKIGYHVYITNQWETLKYRVESIDIIDPNDSDKLRIQEGKDMITLVTCHPYGSHGRYRYLVYCVREDYDPSIEGEVKQSEMTASASDSDVGTGETIAASDGTVYYSSDKDIAEEDKLRMLGAFFIAAVFVFSMVRTAVNKVQTQKRRF